MVVSKCFWLLEYLPFLPATPCKLAIAIWILIPQNEGEKVIYLVLTGYFSKFEEHMTKARNAFFDVVLFVVLKTALWVTEYSRTSISVDKLIDLRKVTESMDQALLYQLKIRGALNKQNASSKEENDGHYQQSKRSYAQEMAVRRNKISRNAKERSVEEHSPDESESISPQKKTSFNFPD